MQPTSRNPAPPPSPSQRAHDLPTPTQFLPLPLLPSTQNRSCASQVWPAEEWHCSPAPLAWHCC